jgi:hypothetical protein
MNILKLFLAAEPLLIEIVLMTPGDKIEHCLYHRTDIDLQITNRCPYTLFSPIQLTAKSSKNAIKEE